MSFFGFDATLPRDRGHDSRAPGFGAAPDPFAGLSNRNDDGDDAIDFEDTYDGLGDQLDETDDAFNDATFGASIAGGSAALGKDFDFSGQTAQIADTMNDGHGFFQAKKEPAPAAQPKPASKPARSGYESYADPQYIPHLEADASIWGTKPKQSAASSSAYHAGQPSIASATTKMMSLEEVEAMMRSQPKIESAARAQQPLTTQPMQHTQTAHDQGYLQHQQTPDSQMHRAHVQSSVPRSDGMTQKSSVQPSMPIPEEMLPVYNQPRHMQQQNIPPGLASQAQVLPGSLQYAPQPLPIHSRGPSLNGRLATHPDQFSRLSEDEQAALLAEEAKRAKRNHKIFLMSRDNGLMSPQDKNFITRIQLQQLVTAIGNVDEQGPEAALTEDFYYQVYSQIRGAPRQHPGQPLSQFAQTYLNQTAGRSGNRRFARGTDQMRRMEQQVQRAVEAAKLKPKNKQLVIEGSLGKISFSNAKTPKPLLNLKRQESSGLRPQSAGRPRVSQNITNRKAVLRNIETLYATLLKMEDHERRMPPPPKEESSADAIEEHMDWRQRIQALNEELWSNLKVLEPHDASSPTPHPFVAILCHPKGKKCIPRVFRQVDDQQRLTILTRTVVDLDMLDVVKEAIPQVGEHQLPKAIRDEVELFYQAVMPCLSGFVNDAPLGIVIGMAGLILERVNVAALVRTKIGLALLTMFISRAELIKQGGNADEAELGQWSNQYNQLFDTLEPQLRGIFPGTINSGEDMYVWQFLAAMGIDASPEQQQRLVIAVKDRVMETVLHARTLPGDMSKARLDNVNLFMRAIGLDVDLLG